MNLTNLRKQVYTENNFKLFEETDLYKIKVKEPNCLIKLFLPSLASIQLRTNESINKSKQTLKKSLHNREQQLEKEMRIIIFSNPCNYTSDTIEWAIESAIIVNDLHSLIVYKNSFTIYPKEATELNKSRVIDFITKKDEENKRKIREVNLQKKREHWNRKIGNPLLDEEFNLLLDFEENFIKTNELNKLCMLEKLMYENISLYNKYNEINDNTLLQQIDEINNKLANRYINFMHHYKDFTHFGETKIIDYEKMILNRLLTNKLQFIDSMK